MKGHIKFFLATHLNVRCDHRLHCTLHRTHSVLILCNRTSGRSLLRQLESRRSQEEKLKQIPRKWMERLRPDCFLSCFRLRVGPWCLLSRSLTPWPGSPLHMKWTLRGDLSPVSPVSGELQTVPGWRPLRIKTPLKIRTPLRRRGTLAHQGVGRPLPSFATPSLLRLERHRDCAADPRLAGAPLEPPANPEAAVIVVMRGLCRFRLLVCPPAVCRDGGIRTSC